MISLQSSQRIAQAHGVKCLVYSRAGMGKTSLTCTAPNPVLISAESGLLCLSQPNIERMYGVNTAGISYNIPVIQIKTVEDLTEAHLWAATSNEARQFQTICIDSVSEVAETILSNARTLVKDPRMAYGELLEKMVATVKAFRDMNGKHVYVTAKEEKRKDEHTNITTSGPAMPGSKLGPALPYLFDEVFHLGKGINPADNKEYRYLRTQPDFTHEAKDRSGALAELEYPHLGLVFNKITGNNAPL